jgi:hypothetical protein
MMDFRRLSLLRARDRRLNKRRYGFRSTWDTRASSLFERLMDERQQPSHLPYRPNRRPAA